MEIVIKARTPDDIIMEIGRWTRRVADHERAFASVATIGKRRIAESLYAASCLERLADSIEEMTAIIEEN